MLLLEAVGHACLAFPIDHRCCILQPLLMQAAMFLYVRVFVTVPANLGTATECVTVTITNRYSMTVTVTMSVTVTLRRFL